MLQFLYVVKLVSNASPNFNAQYKMMNKMQHIRTNYSFNLVMSLNSLFKKPN